MNILVLCTGNSARSILLESLLNKLGDGRVTAFSAGSQPSGKVHPQSLRLLQGRGYEVDGLRSKSWDEFAEPGAPEMDVVITVCASAAGETCPIWPSSTPGRPFRAHWGVEDPAAASEADWEQAFETAYARLEKRAKAFLAAPFETFDTDAIRAHLTNVGTL